MGGASKSSAPGATRRVNWQWKARVWTWERREKLLLMMTRVYAFLLSLLGSEWEVMQTSSAWYHRTGKRSGDFTAPLYRLHSALSRLWQAYLPSPGILS